MSEQSLTPIRYDLDVILASLTNGPQELSSMKREQLIVMFMTINLHERQLDTFLGDDLARWMI